MGQSWRQIKRALNIPITFHDWKQHDQKPASFEQTTSSQFGAVSLNCLYSSLSRSRGVRQSQSCLGILDTVVSDWKTRQELVSCALVVLLCLLHVQFTVCNPLENTNLPFVFNTRDNVICTCIFSVSLTPGYLWVYMLYTLLDSSRGDISQLPGQSRTLTRIINGNTILVCLRTMIIWRPWLVVVWQLCQI